MTTKKPLDGYTKCTAFTLHTHVSHTGAHAENAEMLEGACLAQPVHAVATQPGFQTAVRGPAQVLQGGIQSAEQSTVRACEE